MTYFGKIVPVSSSFILSGSGHGLTYAASPFSSASAPITTYIPIGRNMIVTSSVSDFSSCVGITYLSMPELPTGSVYLDGAISTTLAANTASLALYNRTSASWVQLVLSGVNKNVITSANTTTDIIQSMDLMYAENFSRNAGLYEAILYTIGGTTASASLESLTFRCLERSNSFYADLSSSYSLSFPTNILTFIRTASSYSYQTTTPVSGIAFVVTGATANVPRFHFIPSTNRTFLLVEPQRTNIVPSGTLVDADVNNVPDGWSVNSGTPGTEFITILDGNPYGGCCLQYKASCGASKGIYHTIDGAAGFYTHSAQYQRGGSGGGENYLTWTNGTIYPTVYVPQSTTWITVTRSLNTGDSLTTIFLCTGDDPGENTKVAMPQIELGTYASTWIPTPSGSEIRAPELCKIDSTKVPLAAGVIEFEWCPGFHSDSALTEIASNSSILFAWSDCSSIAAGSCIYYLADDRKIYARNNATNRAASAALTFVPWEAVYKIRLEFGTFGTILYVNGAKTSNSTAWLAPPAGYGYLGSNSAGGGNASGGYANLILEKW